MENKNCLIINEQGVPGVVLKKWQQEQGLIHYFTTKHGGVSEGEFESLNLGLTTKDNSRNVLANYKRVFDQLEIEIEDAVCSKQVHETRIKRVTNEDKGNGLLISNKWESADGIYTTNKGIALVTHYADCVPIFFYCKDKEIIGIAHAGWRGTVGKIAQNMVEIWEQEHGVNPSEIEVFIGPSICKKCFEVHSDVADEFKSKFNNASFITSSEIEGKSHIDLWECNQYILSSCGVKTENIHVANVCTCCNSDIFFSHRKTKGKRGTLSAIMYLK